MKMLNKLTLTLLIMFSVAYAQKKAGTNQGKPEKLKTGKQIFINRCQGCHELPERDALSKNQWKYVLITMQQRMKSSNLKPLSDAEILILYKWLVN